MQAATQRSKRLCRNPSCAPQNTWYVHKHPTCSPSYLSGGTRNPAGNNAVMPMKSTLLCTHCLCPPPPSARDNKRRRHSKTSGQPSGLPQMAACSRRNNSQGWAGALSLRLDRTGLLSHPQIRLFSDLNPTKKTQALQEILSRNK